MVHDLIQHFCYGDTLFQQLTCQLLLVYLVFVAISFIVIIFICARSYWKKHKESHAELYPVLLVDLSNAMEMPPAIRHLEETDIRMSSKVP